MTIYDIKRDVTNAPYFFSRKTMSFFNQTLKDFKVYKIDKNTFKLIAPMKDYKGVNMGFTERIYDSITRKFI